MVGWVWFSLVGVRILIVRAAHAFVVDFSKAFDLICHSRLVKKILPMGIHLKITRWVEEFLKNNTIRVKLGGLSRAKVS